MTILRKIIRIRLILRIRIFVNTGPGLMRKQCGFYLQKLSLECGRYLENETGKPFMVTLKDKNNQI